MIRSFIVSFFMVCLCSFFLMPLTVVAQTSCVTEAQAMARCQADLISVYGGGGGELTCVDRGAGGTGNNQVQILNSGQGEYMANYYYDPTCNPPPPPCQNLSNIVGSIVVPAGSGLPEASSGGCCYIPMTASGGSNAAGQQLVIGEWEPTGQQCDGTHPGLVTGASQDSSVAETTNADGSKTFCDTQNKKCVTVQAGSGAPASSSSSANNETDVSSITHNPASSSSTTTTATTTTTGIAPSGSSSTGGVPGTWSSTGQTTSHSVTDQPASSSSSASKCTSAVCDVGNADGVVGSMYSGSGDSVDAEFATFQAQVASTPLAAAVPQFFSWSPSGTCPTWHIPGNVYWGQSGFDFAFFCQPSILALLTAAGYIVLAVGAFSAFRIALY